MKKGETLVGEGGVAVGERREGPEVAVGTFAQSVGRFIKEALDEPVTLTNRGKAVAVVMGIDQYRRLEELEETSEELYWSVVAMRQDIEWNLAGRPTVSLEEVVFRAGGQDPSDARGRD